MSKVTAYRIRVYGIVQGVGFRPFTARLARKCGVAGTVCNKGSFVEITAEGTVEQVDAFFRRLKDEAPERSVILKLDQEEISPAGADAFRILRSEQRRGDIFVSPDIATCPQCEEELFDPGNRRYLHPFINCTACGPRVTILDRMPYDRVRTSMGMFPMCPACKKEYTGPGSRRYHAQPVCCNDCGPGLYVLWENHRVCRQAESRFTEKPEPEHDSVSRRSAPHCVSDGRAAEAVRGTEALLRTRDVIRNGGIAAVKGIGGYHLCADASNANAVRRLRALKQRPFKPFAVMMRDLKTVRDTCMISEAQEKILTGPNKPILLLQRRSLTADLPDADARIRQNAAEAETGKNRTLQKTVTQFENRHTVCRDVAPDNPYLGVMLPYAPVQMLLFSYPDGREMPDALIMTSGNAKDTPICMNDAEALQFLAPLCDIILSNDREIRLRADDSVMNWFAGEPYMIRRSRGYAPLPVVAAGDDDTDTVSEPGADADRKVLGIGGELKNAFCLSKGAFYYLSPYIGNLADVRGREALEHAVERMKELLEIRPDYIACDLHPRYLSAAAARKMAETAGVPLIMLQHHYAHVLSCMAENNVREPVIGISFDGTGYGTDGTVWGGEFLIADRHAFRRAGSLEPFKQTGGDLAPGEGWRIAAALLSGEDGQSCVSSADVDGRISSGGMSSEGMSSGGMSSEGMSSGSLSSETASSCAEKRRRKRCSDLYNEEAAGITDNCQETGSGKQLAEALGVCSGMEYDLVQTMIRQNINTVTSTSAGRVFDAASAVLGLRRVSTSEGEASMVLQYAAERYWRKKADSSDLLFAKLPEPGAAAQTIQIGTDPETGRFLLPVRWLIRELAELRLNQEQDIDCLAYEFHAAMAELICRGAEICREQTGIQTAALTGGVMQNTLLLHLLTKRLEADGFRVLRHRLVPANDGGIALGQAYYLPESRQLYQTICS